MILHDVADCAGFVVEAASALNTEFFGHRDLHALDIIAVPERFDESVGKAKSQHVVHSLLAEVVIDSEYRAFIEHSKQYPIQIASRRQIASEWFFQDDAGRTGATHPLDLFYDRGEQAG